MLGPAVEPLPPEFPHFLAELLQRSGVPGHSVVPTVPFQLHHQFLMLPLQWPVPKQPTELGDPLDRTREPPLRRLLSDHPVPAPALSPIMGETQKIEGIAILPRSCRFLEPDQPGFLRVKGQSISAEPLREYLHDPARISLLVA